MRFEVAKILGAELAAVKVAIELRRLPRRRVDCPQVQAEALRVGRLEVALGARPVSDQVEAVPGGAAG